MNFYINYCSCCSDIIYCEELIEFMRFCVLKCICWLEKGFVLFVCVCFFLLFLFLLFLCYSVVVGYFSLE